MVDGIVACLLLTSLLQTNETGIPKGPQIVGSFDPRDPACFRDSCVF